MCSAIRDYSMVKNGVVNDNGEPITNENLLAFLKEMRDERIRDERQNRYLLEIIWRQNKPVFLRDVGANLTAATIFEALLCVGSELLNNCGVGRHFRLLTPQQTTFYKTICTHYLAHKCTILIRQAKASMEIFFIGYRFFR